MNNAANNFFRKEMTNLIDNYIQKTLEIEQTENRLQQLKAEQRAITQNLKTYTSVFNNDNLYAYKYKDELFQIEFNEDGTIISLKKLNYI